MSAPASVYIHPTADVSPKAQLGEGVRVWNQAQIREGAVIGRGCIIGKDAYIDNQVEVGAHCKIQNGVFLYHGVTVEDGVFLGPRATTTNDLHPRAICPDGTPKGASDWVVTPTRICRGAAIGAGAIIVCGVTIGSFATVGAGAVVTRSVPPQGLVLGNPARLRGAVCPCGAPLRALDPAVSADPAAPPMRATCAACGATSTLTPEVAAVLT